MPQLGPFPFLFPNSRQSPTLIPNFSVNAGSAFKRGMVKMSPGQFLAAHPRVNASATVTVGGTPANGDVATVTMTHPVWKNPNLVGFTNGSVSASYTQVTGDTLASVAEGLAAAINTSAAAPFVIATSNEAVVTISWPGPVGNFLALAESATGVTLTLSAGTLSGGSGPAYVWDNFQWTARHQVADYMLGNFYLMSGVLYGVVQGAMPVQ